MAQNMNQANIGLLPLWRSLGNTGDLPAGWNGEGGSSSDSSGGGGVQDILNNAVSSMSGLFPNPVTPFETVDPFSFDKTLATQAATAEYDPYYQQLLSDYSKNVQTNLSRSQADLTTTLQQLQQGKDYYTGTEGRMLDQALKQTNEGYAGRGLFFSGARQQDINQIQTQYQADTGNYNNQYDYNVSQAKLTQGRTAEDLSTAQSQYNRDTKNAEKSAIAQGVLQRQTEAQTQYEAARQAYYSAAQYGGQGAANQAVASLPKYSYT